MIYYICNSGLSWWNAFLKLFYFYNCERSSREGEVREEVPSPSYGKTNECAKILIKEAHNNFVNTIVILFKREINFHHEPARPSCFFQGYLSVHIVYRNLCFGQVLELLFKCNALESETIISKILGVMRIFLT